MSFSDGNIFFSKIGHSKERFGTCFIESWGEVHGSHWGVILVPPTNGKFCQDNCVENGSFKLVCRGYALYSITWTGTSLFYFIIPETGTSSKFGPDSLMNDKQTVWNIQKVHISWIPWNLSFHYILFHEKRLQMMVWHLNARVNAHQRWKQMRFRICFHLWCELTITMNVTEWQVSWNSCLAYRKPRELHCPSKKALNKWKWIN